MKKELYKLLKKDVETKLGKKIVRSKDCNELSVDIVKKTGRHISVSTIKRFFGIINSPFKPSVYTLDTFVKYIGYDSCNDYINFGKSESNEPDVSSWEILKERVQYITDYCLVSLKLRTGYNPEKVIFRSFAEERFEGFSNSQKTATLFLSPTGYGKSVTLVQLVEKYFLDEDAPHKDDIVLLIDGSIFFHLYSKNVNFELLNQIIDFKIHSSPAFYFQNDPELRKGRFWLFIDSVDDIFSGKHKYHALLENLVRMIMAYDDGWHKVIFTCRPENLDIFAYMINKNPVLKSSWYEVDFDYKSPAEAVNIPVLNSDEIKQLSKKLGLEYDRIKKNKNLLNLFRNPFVLAFYSNMYKENENISEFELIKRYLEIRLFSPPYMEEKLKIIDSFVRLCSDKKAFSVRKELLFSNEIYQLAYDELISFGLLHETLDSDDLFEKKIIVKFSEKLLFAYILLEKWMQNTKPDISLFYKILHHFERNVQMQCDVLAFFVKYMICRKEFSLVKKIESEIHTKKIFSLPENEFCRKKILSLIKEDSLNVA